MSYALFVFPEHIKNIKTGTLVRIFIVLLAALCVFLSNSIEVLMRSFDTRHLKALLIVQPIVFFCLVLQGIRYAILVDQAGLSYITAIKAITLAQGLNLLIPARISEALKATYLRTHAGVPISAGMSAILLERTVDLIILSILGLLCIFLFVTLVSKVAVLLFATMTITIVSVALWGRRLIVFFAKKLPWFTVGDVIQKAHSHFVSTLRNCAFFWGVGLGLVVWAISIINVFLILEFSSLPKGLYGALLVFVCTTLGGAVPALPGGLGIYEAAAVVALTSLGYGLSEAVSLAVTIHLSQLILPLVLALIISLKERMGLSALIKDIRSGVERGAT